MRVSCRWRSSPSSGRRATRSSQSLTEQEVSSSPMARTLHEVVYVDGVRTAFGRAGQDGLFWKTRADDMGVKVVRELLRRNPELPPDRIDDVAFAATAQ